ncbi:hypothetical protein DFH11DRAFT_1836093, partial [Phellopilus nigrolimitatus]
PSLASRRACGARAIRGVRTPALPRPRQNNAQTKKRACTLPIHFSALPASPPPLLISETAQTETQQTQIDTLYFATKATSSHPKMSKPQNHSAPPGRQEAHHAPAQIPQILPNVPTPHPSTQLTPRDTNLSPRARKQFTPKRTLAPFSNIFPASCPRASIRSINRMHFRRTRILDAAALPEFIGPSRSLLLPSNLPRASHKSRRNTLKQ